MDHRYSQEIIPISQAAEEGGFESVEALLNCIHRQQGINRQCGGSQIRRGDLHLLILLLTFCESPIRC